MQANSAKHYLLNRSHSIPEMTSGSVNREETPLEGTDSGICDPTYFHGSYASYMEMFAEAHQVAQYLDVHQDWFYRCAQPMKVSPLGKTGYALAVGQFGAFGYEVEPKIGLNLLPQDHGVYRIQTLPIPDYEAPGYEVDFQAALSLVEVDTDPSLYLSAPEAIALPARMTRVEWELNLTVAIHFPRFIQALPQPLILTTGDRLLNQIVRQVSRRLTHKVQEDFHSTRHLPFPRKRRKLLWRRDREALYSEQNHD